MIYRRKQVEVDALPIFVGAEVVKWLVMPRRGDGAGASEPTYTVEAEEFAEEFEEGSAARFTEEHLQRLVQQCAQMLRDIRNLSVPSTQGGRPAYREGFTDATQTMLRSSTLSEIQSHLGDIRNEYSDWDARYFTAR